MRRTRKKTDYWTLVWDDAPIAGIPILPLDDNPTSADEGQLVYRTHAGALAACQNQGDMYEIACHPCILGQERAYPRRVRLQFRKGK